MKTSHDIRRERTAKALNNVPVKPTDKTSSTEALLYDMLQKQQDYAQLLKQLIDAPNGIGFSSPHYVPTLQNMLAVAFRIDGFRQAFGDPLGGCAIPTQEENRRWNKMVEEMEAEDGR